MTYCTENNFYCNECNISINLLQDFDRITKIKCLPDNVELRFVCKICHYKNDILITYDFNKYISDYVYNLALEELD